MDQLVRHKCLDRIHWMDPDPIETISKVQAIWPQIGSAICLNIEKKQDSGTLEAGNWFGFVIAIAKYLRRKKRIYAFLAKEKYMCIFGT
ncbi:hypothetical protein SCA6_002797 [Theobroma cacao]